MVLNGAAVRAANTGYRALYTRGFEGAKPVYEPFVFEVPSTKGTEEHHLPGGLPQLRQWVGDRQVQNLRRYKYRLDNEDWELTIGVPRNAFEDDELGIFNQEFQAMGAQARLHPDKLFAEAVEAGFVETGFDDAIFFSTAHPADVGGNQSNLTTDLLDADAFEAGLTNLQSRKNRLNEPVDIFGMGGELYLMVPPALRATAKEIVGVEYLASGASNPNYQAAKIIVNTRLTSATKWYMFLGGGPLRPFIHQMRKRAELVVRDGPADENMWNKKEIQWGIDGRWALGYGLWQLTFASDASGS